MKTFKRALIMAGGTGGHIFPGLALANEFAKHGVEVHWLGTAKGLEARVVPEAGIPLHLITVHGLRGKGKLALLFAPFTLMKAIWQAHRHISAVNPDIVIGMGGFVSGPGGVAAFLSARPLLIHEQNATAGLTNRWLSRVARLVLAAFPTAFKPSKKLKIVGNPVRPDLLALPPPETRLDPKRAPYRLLVLGGSLGAKAINDMLPGALASLDPTVRPEVIHQTGEKHFSETVKLYESMGLNAKVMPFIKNMQEAYAWADVVLCRAGASTVAELCAVDLGAVFVPYPYAVDDHQTANADFMVKEGAALRIAQAALTEVGLADIVGGFSRSRESLLAMATRAYALRRAAVVTEIYQLCREISS